MQRIRLLFGVSVFWLGLSMLTDGLTTLVLPSQLLGLADDASRATTLGLLTFAGLLVGMLIQPMAGALSDRMRPRWGRRGTLGIGTFLILVALAVLWLAPGVAGVFLGFVLIQAAASAAQASQQGFIPDLVPAERRGTAAGFKGLMDIGGALIGFALLGQVLTGGDAGPALLILGIAITIAYLLTVLLVREPPRSAIPPGPPLGLTGAFRVDPRRHRSFVTLVLARFLFLLGAYAVGRFWLYFIGERLGLDADHVAEAAGMLLAALALVTVLASVPAGWAADRFGRVPLMIGGGLVSAVGVLLLIIARDESQILLFGALMSVGTAMFTAANWALTADLVPSAQAARFFGLANVGTAGAGAVAGLAGPLVDWANALGPGSGYPALFLFAALMFVASTAVSRAVVVAARPAALLAAD